MWRWCTLLVIVAAGCGAGTTSTAGPDASRHDQQPTGDTPEALDVPIDDPDDLLDSAATDPDTGDGSSRIGEAMRAWAFMSSCRGDHGEVVHGFDDSLSTAVDFLIQVKARNGLMVNDLNGRAAVGPSADEVMTCAAAARTCADFENCVWHGHAPTTCITTAVTCDHGWARQCDAVGGHRFRVWDCSTLVPGEPDPELRCMDGVGCVQPAVRACPGSMGTSAITRCEGGVAFSCRNGGREVAQPCPAGWVCSAVTVPGLGSFPSCVPNEAFCTSRTAPMGICVPPSLMNQCGLGEAQHLDCAMFGLPCAVLTLIARCHLDPTMLDCPTDGVDRCEGTSVVACQGGRRIAFNCATIAGGTCYVCAGGHARCRFPGSV